MPVKIFVCYAREDEALLNQLKSHLIPLQRQGLIDFWYDRDISAGAEWENEISQHLNAAQIILLLVSPDFMASDYINNVELKRAIERHKRREAHVIPIILRPVYWQGEPLGKLQALPTDGKPVMSLGWHTLDEAFFNVTEGINKFVKQLSINADEYLHPDKTEALVTSSLSTNQSDTRYLIFLLDQSGSMSETFGRMQAGSGGRKAEVIAVVLNHFLNELIQTNTIIQPDGTVRIKNRAEITVLGYEGMAVESAFSGNLATKVFITLPDLHMNPVKIEKRTRREVDEEGNQIEQEVSVPIWIDARAGGGTPMRTALQRARTLVEQWVANHENAYPPIVVNITDGEGSDGDIRIPAYELCQINTARGRTLLYNVHITGMNIAPIVYPASTHELPNDGFAKQLFSLSSVLPEDARERLQQFLRKPVSPGARGLIYNGDAASVRQMLVLTTW